MFIPKKGRGVADACGGTLEQDAWDRRKDGDTWGGWSPSLKWSTPPPPPQTTAFGRCKKPGSVAGVAAAVRSGYVVKVSPAVSCEHRKDGDTWGAVPGERWNSGMIHHSLKATHRARPTPATCASGFLEGAVCRFTFLCYFILFLTVKLGSSFPVDAVNSNDILPNGLH